MRHVLYTEDMEPITVLDVTPHAQQYLDKNGRVNFAVLRPLKVVALQEDMPPRESFLQVSIWREKFMRNGKTMWFLFTKDDETALLLKAAFLPGQTGAIRDREQSAFAKGFITAFMSLGE